MAEENNDVTSTADQSEKVDWIKVLNILHEFLPEDFPEIRTEGEEDRVRTELQMAVYTEPGGIAKIAPTQGGLEKISMQYLLLSTFAKKFSGDPNEPFYFANLPFIFVAKAFVKQYAEKVTRQQMRIILRALRLKEETSKDYLKIFNTRFRKSDVDQFIDDFLGYVSTERNIDRYLFSFGEIMKNLKISEDQLIDFEGDFKIEDSEILIIVRKKRIIYEPHMPTDE